MTFAYFLSRSEPEFMISVNSWGESAIRPRFRPEKRADNKKRQKIINTCRTKENVVFI
jgi:hypothetical protein